MIEVKRKGYYLVRARVDRVKQPIVCVADSHAGHKNFNDTAFTKVIDWIKEKDALWFGGGDLIECSTKTSIGAGWAEQDLTPQEQIDYICTKLQPISDNCLGMLNGNHEDRAFKATGINPTQIIANNIGAPYAGDELFGIIGIDSKEKGKGKTYTLYACHTLTTNKNPGLAFNFMGREISSWINANIICKAHGHDMGLSPPHISISIDTQNCTITETETYYWLVGHYLNRPDSYIAKASKGPKPIGTVALWLDMDSHSKKIVQGEYIR